MYRAHWGLKSQPMADRPDPGAFYESPTHEEALARLRFLFTQRRRLGLLLGELGTGKTMVLAVFAAAARRDGHAAARASLMGIDTGELLYKLLTELGASPESGAAPQLLWRQMVDTIVQNRYQQRQTIILLDDADEASREVLQTVVRLTQCDDDTPPWHTLVLAVETDGLGRLGPRLLAIAQLRVDLQRWEQEETVAYLQWALGRAGGAHDLFDAEALVRIHQLSGGVPRRVAQLADLALVAGAGAQLEQINAATVEVTHDELAVFPPEASTWAKAESGKGKADC